MVIDARQQFGQRFIEHALTNLDNKQTEARLRVMPKAFQNMITHTMREQKEINNSLNK